MNDSINSTQSEAELEDNLIAQLKVQGFEFTFINDENQLLSNLKLQIEQLNDVQLSGQEFKQNGLEHSSFAISYAVFKN